MLALLFLSWQWDWIKELGDHLSTGQSQEERAEKPLDCLRIQIPGYQNESRAYARRHRLGAGDSTETTGIMFCVIMLKL